MQNREFERDGKLLFAVVFPAILVFVQGCGKPSLDREKAAKIIAQSMYPPVIEIKKYGMIMVEEGNQSFKLLEETARELQKLGINTSIREIKGMFGTIRLLTSLFTKKCVGGTTQKHVKLSLRR